MKFRLDIEVYESSNEWAQARYLVHGYDDVLWTDDLDEALLMLRDSILYDTSDE